MMRMLIMQLALALALVILGCRAPRGTTERDERLAARAERYRAALAFARGEVAAAQAGLAAARARIAALAADDPARRRLLEAVTDWALRLDRAELYLAIVERAAEALSRDPPHAPTPATRAVREPRLD